MPFDLTEALQGKTGAPPPGGGSAQPVPPRPTDAPPPPSRALPALDTDPTLGMTPEQGLPMVAETESGGNLGAYNYRYDRTHTASGLYQITNTNWRKYGPQVGIDVEKYPSAASTAERLPPILAREMQTRVATAMFNEQGFKPWAPYNARLRERLGMGDTPGAPGAPGAAPDVAPGGMRRPLEGGFDIGAALAGRPPPKPPVSRLKELPGKIAEEYKELTKPAKPMEEGPEKTAWGRFKQAVTDPIAEDAASAIADWKIRMAQYQKGQGRWQDLKEAAKDAMDVLGVIWAPVTGPIRQNFIDPTMKEIKEKYEHYDELEKSPGGKVVKQLIDPINKMIEFAMYAAIPGGELSGEVKAAREAAKLRQTVRKMQRTVQPERPLPAGEEVGPVKEITSALDKQRGFGPSDEGISAEMRGVQAGTKQRLGDMLQNIHGKTTGYAQALVGKLIRAVDPDMEVQFHDQIPGIKGDHNAVTGIIRIVAGRDDVLQTIIHEVVHAGTVRILSRLIGEELDKARQTLGRKLTIDETEAIVKNPSHQLIKDLDSIIEEANLRHQRAGRPADEFYGLYASGKPDPATGIIDRAIKMQSFRYEFLAEMFSNPKFQEFLSNSGQYASKDYKFRNIMTQLSLWIGQHFGIKNPKEISLLHNAMLTGDQLMHLQSEQKPPRGWIGHEVFTATSVQPRAEAIVAKDERGVITARDMEQATQARVGSETVEAAKRNVGISVQRWIRALHPEGLSGKAKIGAAVIAKALTEYEHDIARATHGAMTRYRFWRARPDKFDWFVEKYEKGENFSDRVFQRLKEHYEKWAKELTERDKQTGLHYEARDHYMYHVFKEKAEEVSDYFTRKYGIKWLDPDFVKDRVFDLYKEAIEAGFTPRWRNPEEIMLARDYASSAAKMRANIFRHLERLGLAVEHLPKEPDILDVDPVTGAVHTTPGRPETRKPPNSEYVRSPTGQHYWIDRDVHQVLHNALFSTSLWSAEGVEGSFFRGMMEVKNRIIPARLAFSLFHPVHVLGIDIAAGWTRATPFLFAGRPLKFMSELVKGTANPIWQTALMPFGKGGWEIVKAFKGDIKPSDLNPEQRLALKTLFDMSISPTFSTIYKSNARRNFMDAFADALGDLRQIRPTMEGLGHAARVPVDVLRGVWHAPWAVLSTLAHPIFEMWIPALKAASALKDAKALLERMPELMKPENEAEYLKQMRRLGKSVENRYGEMSYNRLFWKRWIKDIAVMDTLSLGWQLGFLSEYGGAAMQLGQLVAGKGNRLQMIRKGEMDKVIFVLGYSTLGAATNGLLSWAMTGEFPTGMDYINARIGEKDQNGRDKRVTSMFYSREFASFYKHWENEGFTSAVSETVLNKGSGLVSLVHDFWTGMDEFGRHIRNENADKITQAEQMLAYTLSGLEPISMKGMQTNSVWDIPGAMVEHAADKPLSVFGWTDEPKYMSESKTEAGIKQAYQRFISPRETPYESAEYSKDYAKLREAYQSGSDEYPEMLEKMTEQFKLSGRDQVRLIRSLNSDLTPSMRMFISLGRRWEEQQALLDKMTPEEREIYLPHASKKIRYSYQPPEERAREAAGP